MTEKGRGIVSWRWLALAVSIILNIFLVALIGGHLWQSRRDDGAAASPLSRALARAEAILPPQDAAAFGVVIRRDAPRYIQAARQLTETRQQFWQKVTAEHVDQHEVRRALDAWRTAWNRFLDDFSDTIVAALAEVSPDGRRTLMADQRFQLSRPVPVIDVAPPK
jgi:uncharacterized membrane protein